MIHEIMKKKPEKQNSNAYYFGTKAGVSTKFLVHHHSKET